MKKTVIIILAIIICTFIYKEQKEDMVIIPDSAIRLRVIPNSNSSKDQKMKEKIKKYLENNTYLILKDEKSIDDARQTIKENIPNIEKNIDNIFKNNNYDMAFNIEYGNNYFPEKKYRGINYPEGYYESIIISIGEAKGDNWWCVLFPNLCLLDIEEKKDTEYKLWITESINKIIKK